MHAELADKIVHLLNGRKALDDVCQNLAYRVDFSGSEGSCVGVTLAGHPDNENYLALHILSSKLPGQYARLALSGWTSAGYIYHPLCTISAYEDTLSAVVAETERVFAKRDSYFARALEGLYLAA